MGWLSEDKDDDKGEGGDGGVVGLGVIHGDKHVAFGVALDELGVGTT